MPRYSILPSLIFTLTLMTSGLVNAAPVPEGVDTASQVPNSSWTPVVNDLLARAPPTYSGFATYYGNGGSDPGPFCTPSCGHCGTNFIPANRGYFAAVSIALYRAENCGKCAHVTYGDRKVIVPLVDSCPGCRANSLDLSQQAFGDLVGGLDRAVQLGVIPIQWELGPCVCGRHAGPTQPSDCIWS